MHFQALSWNDWYIDLAFGTQSLKAEKVRVVIEELRDDQVTTELNFALEIF